MSDHILVLDHGSCIGYGTHEELIHTCRIYQEIAQSQLNADSPVPVLPLTIRPSERRPVMNANRIMGGGPAFQKGIADPSLKEDHPDLKTPVEVLISFQMVSVSGSFYDSYQQHPGFNRSQAFWYGRRCHPRKRQCGISKGLFLLWYDACLLRNLCPV